MTKLRHVSLKTISTVCFSVVLLSVAVFALNSRAVNQHSQELARRDRTETTKHIDEAPDQLLTVVGNDDCPLRIGEARVKEAPGHLFTKLTGKGTNLATVFSVPEVTLLNTSGQTVVRFYLAIRSPKSQTTRGLVQSNVAIRPGESYTVKREDFAGSEKVATGDQKGEVHLRRVDPGLSSEKRWIEFAGRSDVYVTIAKVDFENGDSWIIKEGGDVK
ncbi:MAG: hypothetical protein AABO41_17700 [Acidobacteriota bacterium]